MIARRTFTATVVTAAETAGKPVGLANAPLDGGWQGQPNSDGTNFVPYVVVYPTSASWSAGPVSDPSADRHLPYSLGSYGVLPDQTEWMADLVRAAVASLSKTTITVGSESYKVQKVDVEVLGALLRYDQTDPPFWGQVDQISFWLTKEL